MRNSEVKQAAQVLLETYSPKDIVLRLIKVRAYIIGSENYDMDLDLFVMDLCAYFAAMEPDAVQDADVICSPENEDL